MTEELIQVDVERARREDREDVKAFLTGFRAHLIRSGVDESILEDWLPKAQWSAGQMGRQVA